ncbi:MAG: ABC transporter permease [Thaumarchaeota archaeon]|nr:ABC transporter permease [Nitrososphaerota archaeon]
MGLATSLGLRALTLLGVLIAVLLMVVIALGATGLSDKMLGAIVNDQIRGLRQGLSQTIRDPDELERVLEAQKQQLAEFYGLDKPWYLRLPDTVRRVILLDLGSARSLRSFSGSSQVSDLVLERLPNTIMLVTTATIISTVIGLYAGVKLATKVGSKFDRALSYLSAASNALPTWWMGILLVIAFSFQLRIFPFSGMFGPSPAEALLPRTLDLLWHSILPIATLVAVSVGGWTYVVRTMVLNTAQEDFVTVARAKGLPERVVMSRHIVRVAALPILTNIILGLAGSLGGAILTETVFNWPGMGRLYYDAVIALDETVIIALTFMFTLIYVSARFILEGLYIALDPRVRY